MRSIVVIICLVSMSTAWGDSLFSRAVADRGTIVSQKKARFEAGDIVTVIVRETVKASTAADTNTKRESTLEADTDAASNPFLTTTRPEGLGLVKPGLLPNWKLEIENEHKGNGKTSRSNNLVMTVSCVVTKALKNGNIIIEGEKVVTVNREDSKISVTGMARAKDVTTANTVLSDQLANAQIKLKGNGPLWNSQRRGLLTKLLDWFSPF